MEVHIDSARLDRKNILILIPPWRTPNFIYSALKKYIPKDFGYIDFEYSRDLLNSSPYLTKQNIFEYLNLILTKLEELRDKKPRNYYIYAESLGCVPACVLAEKILIKKMVLITPGDDLADCFWTSIETKQLREKMKEKGITLKLLKIIWEPFLPDAYLRNYALKTKYYVKLTKNDKSVPYKNGIKFVELLKKNKVDVSYEVIKIPRVLPDEKFPHKALVLADCIFPKHSMEFLTGKKKK